MTLELEIYASFDRQGKIKLSTLKSTMSTNEYNPMGLRERKLYAERNNTSLPPSVSEQAEVLERLLDCIESAIASYNATGKLPVSH